MPTDQKSIVKPISTDSQSVSQHHSVEIQSTAVLLPDILVIEISAHLEYIK